MSDPRYPIGPYSPPAELGAGFVAAAIAEIEALPNELRAAVAGLDPAQLDTPYRDGGWTVRQVVHHLPDSHLNAYARHKLAIAEENPSIRPYDEARWAELPEARCAEPELSLRLLDALHARWTRFLRALPPESFARTFFHPQSQRTMRLDWSVGMYAWHGRHHTAQVLALRAARGW
jgi:uncharacterized damage-inducible protein DinB